MSGAPLQHLDAGGAAPPVWVDAFTREPAWMDIARSYIGVREVIGPRHQAVIGRWLHALGAWWSDDETPWCGTFVAACLQQSGCELPQHWYRARAWLDWGEDAVRPYVGAVVVLSRGPTMGHVGFVAGWAGSQLLVLGGNQGNAVSIAAFAPDRILGYRRPADRALTALATQVDGPVAASTSEA